MSKVLVYLHGFLSSPQSVKAQATQSWWQTHHRDIPFVCPQLPYYPNDAQRLLDDIATQYQGRQMGFIGSSLGGFLSTYMVNRYGGRAVLINPAANAHEVLSDYLGPHVHPYTGEQFVLQAKHMAQLESMNQMEIASPGSIWALLQTGDETLDYRVARDKYRQGRLTIEMGGDHSFQGYTRFLPEIYRFLFA